MTRPRRRILPLKRKPYSAWKLAHAHDAERPSVLRAAERDRHDYANRTHCSETCAACAAEREEIAAAMAREAERRKFGNAAS